MLNVYVAVQKVNKGFPESSQVKLFKYRELGTRSDAFLAVIGQYTAWKELNPTSSIAYYYDAVLGLIGEASAETSPGAAGVFDDVLISVTTKVGYECELVGKRGY